jgi:excisionase family DNA binding protein
MTGQLLTAEQLAERFQVQKSHVYRLTRDGALPAVKLGRYYRYRLEAIEAFERDGGARESSRRAA